MFITSVEVVRLLFDSRLLLGIDVCFFRLPLFRSSTDLHENEVILNRKIRGKVVGISFS
jgi:hypothetical protein